jgi:hypothetical protein
VPFDGADYRFGRSRKHVRIFGSAPVQQHFHRRRSGANAPTPQSRLFPVGSSCWSRKPLWSQPAMSICIAAWASSGCLRYGHPRRPGGHRFAGPRLCASGSGRLDFLCRADHGHVDLATLVFFAFRNRSDPPAHKRLILTGTIALLIAAIARWPFAPVYQNPIAAALVLVFLLMLVVYDLWSIRKVHRATLWAGAFLIVVQQIRVPLGKTPAWHAFASWAQPVVHECREAQFPCLTLLRQHRDSDPRVLKNSTASSSPPPVAQPAASPQFLSASG